MKTTIETKSREEGEQINSGLKNDKLRAVARIIGILDPFGDADRQWIVARIDELITGPGGE